MHGAFVLLVSVLGAVAAGRQVWLQQLPAEQLAASCGPDLSYLLNNYPFLEAIKYAFQGSGECGEVVWHFLGFSIPEWTLLFFILFAGVGVWQLAFRFKRT